MHLQLVEMLVSCCLNFACIHVLCVCGNVGHFGFTGANLTNPCEKSYIMLACYQRNNDHFFIP